MEGGGTSERELRSRTASQVEGEVGRDLRSSSQREVVASVSFSEAVSGSRGDATEAERVSEHQAEQCKVCDLRDEEGCSSRWLGAAALSSKLSVPKSP